MVLERSYLFVPGDRPERFDKALASGADRVILDLEDAVQPAAKDAAREAIMSWLRARGRADGFAVVIRINGIDTPWHTDDLAAFGCVSDAIAGLMLPKAESVEAVKTVRERVGKPLIALLETVAGLVYLRQIAASRELARIAFGSVDFCSDAGIEGDNEALDVVRSQLVIESRFAGLPPPIDGVSLALDDEEHIRRDVARARRFGFGGKLCIHPKQVPAVNAGFSPSADDLAWAKRVVAAAEGSKGRGAIAVDGKLVDKPVLDRAHRLLTTVTT